MFCKGLSAQPKQVQQKIQASSRTDLYAQVHDWLAETMQKMDQDQKDATPGPTLESEVIALLLDRLSGQLSTTKVSVVLWQHSILNVVVQPQCQT